MSRGRRYVDIFINYEDGKHRRYGLLFAVSGGAFTIAKLFGDNSFQSTVLGNLTLSQLSLGMVLFTIIMVVDIFLIRRKNAEADARTLWLARQACPNLDRVTHFSGMGIGIVWKSRTCPGSSWLLCKHRNSEPRIERI